jgi:hypothetical protein
VALKSICLALASIVLPALTLPAMADERSDPNSNPTATAAPTSGVSTFALAHDLYRSGLAQSDALTVLAAARLAASVAPDQKSPAALDLTKEQLAGLAADRKPPLPLSRPLAENPTVSLASTGADIGPAEEGAADALVTAKAMLTMARELAADDPALLGLIDDAMAESPGGRAGTAVRWLSHLPAGQTDLWEVPFYENTLAEIAVIGDGETNLDFLITDETGNLLCHDVGWSDLLLCDFTPARDGYFYVTVLNMGGLQNTYYLLTN